MIYYTLCPSLTKAMQEGKIRFSHFKPGRDDSSTSIHCKIPAFDVADAFPDLAGLSNRELKDADIVDDVTLRIGLGNVQTTNPDFDMDNARLLDLAISRVGGVRTAPFLVATKAVFGVGSDAQRWTKNTVTFTGDGR